ncbi:putative glucan endo-1,3-beta-glucosidase btgC [Elsinoe australis]|uniref:glucan endo-1,3-beta-D-glucosidase n=1 Tax=Elsinoe australis TaxID=40998 RepID=A0A4U7AUD8_9PEZI|nr:putative glucan endo-1,3-beta-glucosidase btgC [Elsinoe australis]
MREVSSAASYNAVWKPPRRTEYEDPPPSYPPHYSSLPSTPHKSTSPSRSHIASPQAQPLVTTQTQPRDRISYSPTRNTFATSGAGLTFPQSAMANSGDRWGPPQDHNYYNVPPPPPQGYHMDNMDDRYQDTSYGGHNGGYNGGYGGYDGDSSMRDNHFNRNSFYEHGAYPDMTPSPARLSRPEFDAIDPHSIADEDDARDFPPTRDSPGKKRLSKIPVIGAAAVGSGAGAGAYSAVGQGGSSQMLNAPGSEKAAWRDMEEMDRKRRKRNIWIIIAVVAVLAIAGGVVGGVLGSRKSGSSSSGGSSAGSSSKSDGLNLNSKEIQALMNNKDLHKVFPVMDYTAYKTQYPDCVLDPPSQDNVTMDLAVLSQLTPAVRVYGTDCNQTEMIMTAIDRLNMNDTMKVWLGVWIDGNQTTNDRQMSHMYDLLDKYPQEHFLGVIVGNEALFRKEITETELTTLLSDVRKNLTSKGINLSVSTSDLGSAWTQGLAAASDHVMGNIHPFFAGVPAPAAAGWTYVFWQGNNVAIAPEPANAKPGAIPRNIISEVGWPSGGGNDCGTTVQCSDTTSGSVAGVPEMNQFMDEWVCGANNNGTMYFWFEAYDEPWKVIYNTDKEQWEDKWGLMGIDRKLKPGIKIPDCGGKTVSLPSK